MFAQRGGTYWYEIVPMIGTPGSLEPDSSRVMRTNSVTLDSKRGNCSVFFNRGIISTQAIAHSLPKGKTGLPNASALQAAIKDASNPIRKHLVGDLENGVLMLLNREVRAGAPIHAPGDIYSLGATLYELSTGHKPQDGQYLDPGPWADVKIREIVLASCTSDPEERPTMKDIIRLLRNERWEDIQAERRRFREVVGVCLFGGLAIAAVLAVSAPDGD